MNADGSDGAQPTKPLAQRNRFTPAEDLILRSRVENLGMSHWKEISQFLPRRSPRQCRDRCMNYLMDSLVRNPWTPQEDALVVEQVREIGPKWVEIGKMLHGRSATNVKNRWYKRLRKLDAGFMAPDFPAQERSESSARRAAVNLSEILGVTDSSWPLLLAHGHPGTGSPPSEAGFWTDDEFLD
jgi:hypothetical protein